MNQHEIIAEVLERQAAAPRRAPEFPQLRGRIGGGGWRGSMFTACGPREFIEPTRRSSRSAAVRRSTMATSSISRSTSNISRRNSTASPRPGPGCPPTILTGTGQPGDATGGRMVSFTDPVVRQYANEIATDEKAHVVFLRTAIGNRRSRSRRSTSARHRPARFRRPRVAAGLITPGTVVRPLCERRKLPARRLHLRGCRSHRLQRRGAAPQEQDLPVRGRRNPRRRGLPRRARPDRALCKGHPAPALVDATEKISNARDALDNADRRRSGRHGLERRIQHRSRPTATASPTAGRRATCSTSSI